MPGHKRQRTSSSTFVDAQTAQALLSSSNSPADKARILDVATSTPPLGHAARQNELRWVKYVAARETLEMLRYRSPAEILNMMQPSVAAQPSIMAQTASLSFLTPKQEHKSIMPSQGGMSSTTSSAIKSADAEVEPQLGQRGASGNPILATSDGGLNVGSASTDYKGQANHLDNKPFMHASSPILGSQSDNVVAGTPGYQYNEYMSVGTDGSTKFIGSGHQIPPSPKPHPSFSLNFAPSIGTPKTAAAAANAEAKPKKKEAPRPRKKAARKKGQAVAPINAAEATEPSGFTGLVKLKTAASKQGQNEAPTSAATEATGRLEYSVPADAKTAEALSELLEEGKVVYDQKKGLYTAYGRDSSSPVFGEMLVALGGRYSKSAASQCANVGPSVYADEKAAEALNELVKDGKVVQDQESGDYRAAGDPPSAGQLQQPILLQTLEALKTFNRQH